MHLLEGITPLVKESRKSWKEEEVKSPASGGIQTHDLQIEWLVLYDCSSTAAYKFKLVSRLGPRAYCAF